MRSGEAFIDRVWAVALAVALALALLGAAEARAATFTVNSTGDEPDSSAEDDICFIGTGFFTCTLRAAIQEANRDPDPDVIDFEIPGAGIHTIDTPTDFPTVSTPVTIDGYTEGGASPNSNAFGKPLNTELRIELRDGLQFQSGSSGSVVKGLAIGGTGGTGITMLSGHVEVEGSFIGTNPQGTAPRPNTTGVFSEGTGVIGGPGAEDRNLISGNSLSGVVCQPCTATGNYIGTKADGRSPLPNDRGGVNVRSGSISPFSLIEGNLIAFNDFEGIGVAGSASASRLTENRVFGNDTLNIDLGLDGLTPNDHGDSDAGPNGRQNYPVLTSVENVGDGFAVEGTLDSNPETRYKVEFFTAEGAAREARKFMGSKTFRTDVEGQATFRFVNRDQRIPREHRMTATASDIDAGPFGVTSELSRPRKVE